MTNTLKLEIFRKYKQKKKEARNCPSLKNVPILPTNNQELKWFQFWEFIQQEFLVQNQRNVKSKFWVRKSSLLAAESGADGVSLSNQAITKNGHGSRAVLVNEGPASISSISEGVAVEESLDLLQDGVDEGLVLEELGQLADEAGAGLAVQGPSKFSNIINKKACV